MPTLDRAELPTKRKETRKVRSPSSSLEPEFCPEPTSFPQNPHLPENVIYEIATYATDKTIWRMMACTRSMREAAERALQPYLREKVITVNPPWLSDEKREYSLLSGWTDPR